MKLSYSMLPLPQYVLSSNLRMAANWGDQLIHWREGLPPRGTWTGWRYGKFLKLNKDKCKILSPGRKTLWQRYSLGTDGLGSRAGEKALWALEYSKQYTQVVETTNSIQGCINRSTGNWSRERIFTLFSAPIRPQLDTTFQFEYCNTGKKTSINWS